MQSGFVATNGIRIHYSRTGGDGPPLVLAHGFSDDGLCWLPTAEALAPDYDLILVDARGHGRSDGPETGYSNADHASDLAGVIDSLKLDHPTVLGHSMGALNALALAALHPASVGAILLEDPPPLWMPELRPPPGEEVGVNRFRAWLVDMKRKTFEELLIHQGAEEPGWSAAELVPWANAKLRLSFNVFTRSESPDLDWPALAARITCPALLITGDAERGALIDAAAASAFQALLPQAHIAHIPGAGHSIRRDRFEPYLEAVRGFSALM